MNEHSRRRRAMTLIRRPSGRVGATRSAPIRCATLFLAMLTCWVAPAQLHADDCVGPSFGPGSLRLAGSLRYPSDELSFSSLPAIGAAAAYELSGRLMLLGDARIPLDDDTNRFHRRGVELGAALRIGRLRGMDVCPLVSAGYESHRTESSRLGYSSLGLALGRRVRNDDDRSPSFFVVPSVVLRRSEDDGDVLTSVRPFADLGVVFPMFKKVHTAVVVRRAFLDGGQTTIGVEIGTVFD